MKCSVYDEFRKHENLKFRNGVNVSKLHSLSMTLQFPIEGYDPASPVVTSPGKGSLYDRDSHSRVTEFLFFIRLLRFCEIVYGLKNQPELFCRHRAFT